MTTGHVTMVVNTLYLAIFAKSVETTFTILPVVTLLIADKFKH